MDENLSPMSLGVSIAAMTLSLAAIGVAAARAFSGRPLVPYEPREPAPWTGWDVAWVLMYVSLSLLGAVKDVVVGTTHEPARSPGEFLGLLAFMAALQTGIIVLALACARLRTRFTLRDFGLDGARLVGDVRLGLAAFLVALSPVYLVQAIVWYGFGQQQPHVLLEMVAAEPQLFWPCAVSAVIVAPIAEELMFRLLLQGWLERVLRRWRAAGSAAVAIGGTPLAAASPDGASHSPAAGFAPATGDEEVPAAGWNPYRSPEYADSPTVERATDAPSDVRPGRLSLFLPALLFALVHGWPDCLPLFLFALVLGYLYRQTHRIVPCIVLHMGLNGASMFLLWLELR